MAINSRPTNQSPEYNILYEIYKKLQRLINVTGSGGGGGGDATAANQVIGNNSLSNIDTKVATETTLSAINTKTPALGAAAGAGSIPVIQSVETATGNITTQNLVPAGVATAGSAVEITLNGTGSLGVQVTGTYTGALSLQLTLNGTTWVTVGGTPFFNLNTGAFLTSITSALQSVIQVDVSGALRARITALAPVTGTATVTLIAAPSEANTLVGVIQPPGTFLSVVVPSSGTSIAKTEDVASASGETGVFVLGVRRDGPVLSTQTSTAGDYSEIAVGTGGEIYVRNRPMSYSRVTADGQVKGSAGHIHTISVAPTGSVTAGVLTIYDSLTESGTVIYSVALPATTFTPFTILLNVAAATGIFVGFDATLANVQVTTSYL